MEWATAAVLPDQVVVELCGQELGLPCKMFITAGINIIKTVIENM